MPEDIKGISFDMTPQDLKSSRPVTPHNDFLYVENCTETHICTEIVYKFEEDIKGVLRLIFVRYGPGMGEESLYLKDEEGYKKLLEIAETSWGDIETYKRGGIVIFKVSQGVIAFVSKEPFSAIWIGSEERLGELLF